MSGVVFPLKDLLQPVTQQEAERSMYDGLEALQLDTTVWSAGSVVRQIITIMAVMIAALSQLVALTVKGAFLQYATGPWLTSVARYVFNTERLEAQYATGELTLSNTGAGSYSYGPFEMTFLNSATGKLFKNLESFSLGANTEQTILVQAVEAGSASTSLAGAIDTFSTPLINVQCSNESALVGRDAETDQALRARASEKLGTLAPTGNWDSYTYVAKSTTLKTVDLRDTGVSANVTRTRIDKDGFGNVWIYCATPSGALEGTIGDRTTPLGEVDYQIQHYVTPICVAAHVVPATEVVVNVQYSLFAYTGGRNADQIKDAVAASIAAWMSTRPIGGDGGSPGVLYRDRLSATIVDSLDEVYHVVLASPASDLSLAINEVAVLGTIDCTGVTFTNPPEGYQV